MRPALFLLLFLSIACQTQKPATNDPFAWQVSEVLKAINPPTFTDKTFPVDASGNFQKAVNEAIDACHRAGGGRVVVPAGEHVCNGPIRLLSNVNLHLSEGTTIRFGTNPANYLPVVKVRWEGTVCYNYSPLIHASGQHNIAITGRGTLDGQADKFWFAWKKQLDGNDQELAKKMLRKMGETGTPEAERVFGEGHKLRPSLIEFYECQNILLDGFTAHQSPFWTIHPVFSKNLTIRNLTIGHGTTNDDGIDPDSCEDVLIENCRIDTDDDPISLKAGRDQDAWKRPGTRNVVVRNCTLRSNVGNGFCIGSEMSGGVERVWIDNCTISLADHGLNIKANLDRGGFVRDVWVRNVRMDSCRRAAIRMQMDYHSYRGGNFPPDFDRIIVEKINVRAVRDYGWWLVGVPAKPIGQIVLRNVTVGRSGKGNEVKLADINVLDTDQPK
ncbi:MAG: glycoside hydrolase family 28 protein [Cytophagales bacterium]|nr:MAG: glycoside hydrolase family 28 protein [Cytophagales bacterium]